MRIRRITLKIDLCKGISDRLVQRSNELRFKDGKISRAVIAIICIFSLAFVTPVSVSAAAQKSPRFQVD